MSECELHYPTTNNVQVVGALLPFTPRQRTRILTYVKDKLDEEAEGE
jgi:hypothetical protein